VSEVLRAGVLAGVRVEVAGSGTFATAVRDRAAALGAGGDGPMATLVVDASGAGDARAVLDSTWDIVQPAGVAMIEAGGGQIVLIAPPGDEASRSGLETMARTLSIEWARHAIRPVAILPGTATSPAEVAELVAYLASEAGAYYAGCAFTLGSATGA
jgi:NAD(P)-dependent dehydrogenase (short-subunit alcohol dehydrogenase family)